MKNHRRQHQWPKGLCAVALATAALLEIARADADEYAIVGDISEAVMRGEVILSRTSPNIGGTDVMTRVPIADGRFRIAGSVTGGLGVVSLRVEDAAGKYKGAARFVLEPGEIRIDYINPAVGFLARGGPYHQRLTRGWQNSDEYLAAIADYAEVMAATAGLDKGPEYGELMSQAARLQNKRNRIRGGALRAIALSDDDPLASFLAIAMGGMSGSQALERLDELEAATELPALAGVLRTRNETLTRISARTRFVAADDKVDAFDAAGLNGEAYRLEDALAENKLVLIEFWASWCGPCRAEVPNLKTAVEQFGDRGFAIFAFSLDTDHEDWEDASLEDGITWINTSDLMGYDSPTSEQFGVRMVPMNLLVDSNGVVVDTHARGERLLETLSEMLAEEI